MLQQRTSIPQQHTHTHKEPPQAALQPPLLHPQAAVLRAPWSSRGALQRSRCRAHSSRQRGAEAAPHQQLPACASAHACRAARACTGHAHTAYIYIYIIHTYDWLDRSGGSGGRPAVIAQYDPANPCACMQLAAAAWRIRRPRALRIAHRQWRQQHRLRCSAAPSARSELGPAGRARCSGPACGRCALYMDRWPLINQVGRGQGVSRHA